MTIRELYEIIESRRTAMKTYPTQDNYSTEA